MSNKKIEHIFILMLENHSFDNVFGASGIPGIKGIDANSTNSYNGKTYQASMPAPDAMGSDPGHEFQDTVEQLCGSIDAYQPFKSYPEMNNSGFVSNFATSHSEDTSSAPHPNKDHYEDVMRCFDTKKQLPVIYQLATEFALCDNWFSSMPGPTWPNRFFAYGATAASLDDSPSKVEMIKWEGPGGGIQFPNGSVFDMMRGPGVPFRLYQENLTRTSFPIVLGLKGISYNDDMHNLSNFEEDLKSNYNYALTLIEPDYGNIMNGTFQGGSSQHPMDGMQAGERLIKKVYEAIRGVEEVWEKSMLIITYDEHGGFYDSVAPPAAVPPNDFDHLGGPYSSNGFIFDRLGISVPSVVVSPFIPKNTVSHTVFDHSSMLKTLEEMTNLPALTDRDKHANSLLPLLTNDSPRKDCPITLNAVDEATVKRMPPNEEEMAQFDEQPLPERGNHWGFLAVANKIAHETSSGTAAEAMSINEEFRAIQTKGHARELMAKVLDQAKK